MFSSWIALFTRFHIKLLVFCKSWQEMASPNFPCPRTSCSSPAAEQCRSEIIKANCLNSLPRFLQGRDNNLTCLAVSFIRSLAVGPTNCSLIVEAGLLGPLASTLKHSYIQWEAAKTLSILAAGTENDKPEFVNAGVIQSIKELLMEAPPGVQAEMIACIRNLSCSGMGSPINHIPQSHLPLDDLRGRMLEMGIGGVLVRLCLSMHCLRPRVKYESRTALQDLAKGRAINFWYSLRIKLAL